MVTGDKVQLTYGKTTRSGVVTYVGVCDYGGCKNGSECVAVRWSHTGGSRTTNHTAAQLVLV